MPSVGHHCPRCNLHSLSPFRVSSIKRSVHENLSITSTLNTGASLYGFLYASLFFFQLTRLAGVCPIASESVRGPPVTFHPAFTFPSDIASREGGAAAKTMARTIQCNLSSTRPPGARTPGWPWQQESQQRASLLLSRTVTAC